MLKGSQGYDKWQRLLIRFLADALGGPKYVNVFQALIFLLQHNRDTIRAYRQYVEAHEEVWRRYGEANSQRNPTKKEERLAIIRTCLLCIVCLWFYTNFEQYKHGIKDQKEMAEHLRVHHFGLFELLNIRYEEPEDYKMVPTCGTLNDPCAFFPVNLLWHLHPDYRKHIAPQGKLQSILPKTAV